MANKTNMTTWMFHMFHKYLIMTHGFKNITQGTQIKGFQLNIRTPAYRGLFLSLINSVKLKVDGEEFQFEEMSFKYNGHYFSCNDLKKASDVHMFYGDPLTLIIDKPGGLKPGVHNLELKIYIRPFVNPNHYKPVDIDPNIKISDEDYVTAQKSISLVQ